jgi:hypothetical protein
VGNIQSVGTSARSSASRLSFSLTPDILLQNFAVCVSISKVSCSTGIGWHIVSYYHSVQNLLSSRFLSKDLKIRIYKTIILPVVLYGCETWSLTIREEHGLRVSENRVLRRIFGPKRDEVTGEWRKLA